MKDNFYTIKENREIVPGTYLLTLSGDASEITSPGQFINIKLEGLYLRRPMSICDFSDDSMTIVYRAVGAGTEMMAEMGPGEGFYALCPLGKGFNTDEIPANAILTGGGAGAMPMYALAKELIAKGKDPILVLGFNSKDDIFFADQFRALGARLHIATMDGSVGAEGTVIEMMKEIIDTDDAAAGAAEDGVRKLNYVCACGPDPMLAAVAEYSLAGQFDLSARMACGFGACMGCTIETAKGPARVCKEGPVFRQEDILW